MFQIRPAKLLKLKQRISDEIDAIPPAMLLDTVGNVLNEVRLCIISMNDIWRVLL